MKAFAQLLDALSFQHGRNGKIALLRRYIEATPDPDRGWALAALTGDLSLRQAKPALVRGLVMERVDEVLFKLSYDYVGDLAETVALIWAGTTRRKPHSVRLRIDRNRGTGRKNRTARHPLSLV